MSSLVLFPPYRAEHIGSLKRPSELLQKRAALERGEISEEDLRPVVDKAVKAVVEMQREIGIKAITDGEFRRFVNLFVQTSRSLLTDYLQPSIF